MIDSLQPRIQNLHANQALQHFLLLGELAPQCPDLRLAGGGPGGGTTHLSTPRAHGIRPRSAASMSSPMKSWAILTRFDRIVRLCWIGGTNPPIIACSRGRPVLNLGRMNPFVCIRFVFGILPFIAALLPLATGIGAAADGWTRHYDTGLTGDVVVEPQYPSSDWDSGFSGEMKIINNGAEEITSWTLQFDAPWMVGWNGADSWEISGGQRYFANPVPLAPP